MQKEIKINVKDCVKIFKNNDVNTVAIRKLKCKFYPGEISIIMGPSGSGKTTFLNILGGLDLCDSGLINYRNQDITKFSEEELEKYRFNIGFLFQFFNLIEELTAAENIALPMIMMKKPRKYIKSRVNELLDQVGLIERAKHKPSQLSGGEQQRIAYCVAIANNPDILLCDEPTGELDTQSTLNILNLLHSQIKENPNISIIVVTHDPIFKQIADRLYYIKDGTIIHEMNKDEITQDLKDRNLDHKSFGDQDFSKKMETLIDKESIVEDLLELQNLLKEKLKNLTS